MKSMTPQNLPSTSEPSPLPPEEKFWERYSPHYEFPLSSVGAVAIHVAVILGAIGLLYLLAQSHLSDKTPVPIREFSISDDSGDGPGSAGSGGGGPKENVDPTTQPMDPNRAVPERNLETVVKEVKDFVPVIPDAVDAPRVEDLPALKKLEKLNEDLRKALLEGKGGNKGAGTGDGSGKTGQVGKGSGGTGDPTSSQSRGIRWQLNFRTSDGRDYLMQLAAMKATVAVPEPSDWKELRAFNQLDGKGKGVPFNRRDLPSLHFIDDQADSAGKVARALGLDYSPPFFVAFFTKEVEEELAEKERRFKGRKEGEIYSTEFNVIVRDGKYTVVVSHQEAVRR
jgi:hypothetical protein